MKIKRIIFYLCLSLLSLNFGCGQPQKMEDASDFVGIRPTLSGASDLTAQYYATCQKVQSGEVTYYLSSELSMIGSRPEVFRRSQINYNSTYYSDAQCSKELFKISQSGSFSLENAGREIHLAATAANTMPVTETLARKYNDEALCGLTDWRAGLFSSILNTSCYYRNNLAILFVNSLQSDDRIIEVYTCPDNLFEPTDCMKAIYTK